MRHVKQILILTIILTFAGCSVKEYYFPMSELTDGKVYKYECKSDPNQTQYWKLTYDSDAQVLTTEAYESDFRQYELFKEKVTDKGTEAIEFISYIKKQEGIQLPVNHILKDVDVFRWSTKEPYKYTAETDYDGEFTTIFTKERTYEGESKINVLGEDHKAIKLKGDYKTVVVNSSEKFEYSQHSYYVKGVGLAKMEKQFSDGRKVDLELTEIMTIDEWNKRQ
jgi:hypothetical protein